jgi:uncharacterized lipoprotein YbaY
MNKNQLYISLFSSLLLISCSSTSLTSEEALTVAPTQPPLVEASSITPSIEMRHLKGRLVANRPFVLPPNSVAHIRLLDITITPENTSAELITQAEFVIPALPRDFAINSPKESLAGFPKLYVAVQITHEGKLLYNNLLDVIVTPETERMQVLLKELPAE